MSDGDLAGERLARAARAAHDLSDALWESLHEELAGAVRAERARELAQRLADVCSTIALLAAPNAPAAREEESSPITIREESFPITIREESFPITIREESFPITIREEAFPTATRQEESSPLEPPEPNRDAGIEVRDARPPTPPTPRRTLAGQPLAEDEEESGAPWIGSIGRRLERHREDRLPFAVLLVEIVDFDRLAHAEPPAELTRLTDHVERAIGAELRPADLLTRETVGRYWLVTPETDTPGARNLAERLAGTVRLSARHRGVPLELAIGIAVCPDDGRDASALAAHADVGVYAARAAGRSVAPADDPTV